MPANTTLLDILLLTVAGVGLPAWSFYNGRWYARRAGSHGTRSSRYWQIAVRGVVLSTIIAVAWWKANRPFSALGLDLPVGVAGRVGLVLDTVIVGYYFISVQFVRRSPSQLAATRDRLRRLGSYEMLPQTPGEFAVFPIAAIAGSACEELLYRGFLIGFLAPVLGTLVAIGTSSLLFGLGHVYQGRLGVLRTAVIGIGFGAAFALTHSLWWLVVAHASANLSGVLLARRMLAEAPESVESRESRPDRKPVAERISG